MTDTVHTITGAVLIAPGLTLAVRRILAGRPADSLTAVAKAAGILVETDHARCESPDCDAVICCCHAPTTAPVCLGTVEQGCIHHSPLCHACAPQECRDCLDLCAAEGWGWAR